MQNIYRIRQYIGTKSRNLWIALIAVLLLTSAVFASNPSFFEGKPAMFSPKLTQGYFIWHDVNGIHLRVTTAGEQHVFSGTLQTDGSFEDLFETNLEGEKDYAHIRSLSHAINFQLTSSGRAAGIDFNVYRGQKLNFELYMDDQSADPQAIFVGEEGWHPSDNSFTFYSDNAIDRNRTVEHIHTPIIYGDFDWFWWGGPHHWHGHGHHHGHHH